MYAKTFGETVCGINGEEIIVEVDISNGLPGFDIVGLPDTAVKESRERARKGGDEKFRADVSHDAHYRKPCPGRFAQRRQQP